SRRDRRRRPRGRRAGNTTAWGLRKRCRAAWWRDLLGGRLALSANQVERIAADDLAEAHEPRAVGGCRIMVLQHAHRPAPLRVDAAALHLFDRAAGCVGGQPFDRQAFALREPERARGVEGRVEDGAEVLGDAKFHSRASIDSAPMRSSFARGAALLAALLISQAALAQAWPNRPVRFLVPFAAGAGINDIMARLMGQHLGAILGQAVVIENRAGAGGIAGTDAAAKAAPDGYTFLMTNVSLVTSAYLYPKLPYDPQKDFVPVTLVATSPP